MVGSIVRQRCPHCSQKVPIWTKAIGPNVCPYCFTAFCLSRPSRIPMWVWGVVALLVVISNLLLG
jgi:hypothetical protein